MNQEDLFYVVLSRADCFDLQRLADVLTSVLSEPRMDVIARIRNFWGLLHKTKEIEKAQEVQEKLMLKDLDSFILPASEFKMAPSPKVLKHASPEPQGLIFEEDGQQKTLPWNSFELLCSGQVIEVTSVKKRVLGDGNIRRNIMLTGISPITAISISHNRIKGKQVVESSSKSSFILDLISGISSDSIRILGSSFNYAYLKERMGYNALMNFRNLYSDVAGFLPNAKKNQGAQAFEANQLNKMKYKDIRHFENEKLWLLQLMGR